MDLTEDGKDYLAPPMTGKDRKSLIEITNNLWMMRNSLPFRKSVKHTPIYYMVLKDLWTLRRKFKDGGYASLQEFKQDFRLVIDNGLQLDEPGSRTAKEFQALNAKFEETMAKFSLGNKRDSEYMATDDSSSAASTDSAPGEEPLRLREIPSRAAKRAVHIYRDPALGDFSWIEKITRPSRW